MFLKASEKLGQILRFFGGGIDLARCMSTFDTTGAGAATDSNTTKHCGSPIVNSSMSLEANVIEHNSIMNRPSLKNLPTKHSS